MQRRERVGGGGGEGNVRDSKGREGGGAGRQRVKWGVLK